MGAKGWGGGQGKEGMVGAGGRASHFRGSCMGQHEPTV